MRIEKEMNTAMSLNDFLMLVKNNYTNEAKAKRVTTLLATIENILDEKIDNTPTTLDGVLAYVDLEKEDIDEFNKILFRFALINGYAVLHNTKMPSRYLSLCDYIDDKDQIFEYIFIKTEEAK